MHLVLNSLPSANIPPLTNEAHRLDELDDFTELGQRARFPP